MTMTLRRTAVLAIAGLLVLAGVAVALPPQASHGQSQASDHSGRDVPASDHAPDNGTGNGTHAGGLATALEHVPAQAARVLHAIQEAFGEGGHAIGAALSALLGHGAAANAHGHRP